MLNSIFNKRWKLFPDSVRGVDLPKDYNAMNGAQIYDGYCAACHQAQDQGPEGGGLPSLLNNTSLGHANSNNLVQVLLHGIEHHGADSVMPGFAHELTTSRSLRWATIC